MAKIKLLDNASATGSAKNWPGGRGHFKAVGTFGGATLTLQELGPDDTTWIAVGPDVTLTAAGNGNFEITGSQVRVAVSGGSPSALYASVETLPV